MAQIYDSIVIGGGPGGYTAALYLARAGLSVLVLEKLSAGGLMALTEQIDNYPGFEEGIDGFTLGEKMQAGAERFGALTELAEVQKAELLPQIKKIHTDIGEFLAKTVVIATGADPKRLGIANEEELTDKGVHYCASCDGMAYKGKVVAVVGGGDTAALDAKTLSRICKKVYVIHRRDTLRAAKVYHEPLMNTENIEFVWDSEVAKLLHGERLNGVKVKNVKTGNESELKLDGLFVSIGRNPNTELFKGEVKVDASGYIIAGEDGKTNISGVFAVGDVRTKALRQIITAAADGANAAHGIEEYLT